MVETGGSDLYQTIVVTPFGAALGAQIEGVDLGGTLSDLQQHEIQDALRRHLVVAFRNQVLTDEQHLAFAATLGEPYIHPMDRLMGVTEPSMGELLTNSDHQTRTDTWHLDVTYAPAPPAFGILRCLVAPPFGGDTMWANLHLAFDELSPVFRQRLIGLETVHSVPEILVNLKSGAFGPDAPEIWRHHLADVRQPVIRQHPETGRLGLFAVSTDCPIADMTPTESAAILGILQRHATNPNYTCRWRWNANDVVVWDERCTAHFAVRDPWTGPRHMRRVLVEGDRAIAATA